jgi:type VI secretion system secreted protein VgrG
MLDQAYDIGIASAAKEFSSRYTQKNKAMAVKTPLGEDALLLTGFIGQEALSQPFTYELKVLAPADQDVPFEKLLGQSITVEMELPGSRWPREKKRFFNGICNSITEGGKDNFFTEYSLRLVPRLWLLTKKAGSRIFQHLSIPDILAKVLSWSTPDAPVDTSGLAGLDAKRDYCVQYRETDFNFVSRLMEEEGIYYYFVHEDGKHTMVLANTPNGHNELPFQDQVLNSSVPLPNEDRIITWAKTQEIRATRYVLRDHCFELTNSPGRFKDLEVQADGLGTVSVGDVKHQLKAGGSDLTLYDYPGEYAQRFDGIDRQGGEQLTDLAQIRYAGERAAKIRMQQEALPSVVIRGAGNARQFQAGHTFTHLVRKGPKRVPDGQFVLATVSHSGAQSGYQSDTEAIGFRYFNNFTAIPDDQTFRPPQRTPKPMVHGTQTAVVVGLAPDDDIFTDKYGRVKVQFHWDRDGKFDADSSCWIRVATPLAGQGWGMIHIPRVGQEVVVGFEEGDPDRPIILGCVYNAGMMPPYKLPDKRTQSGLKTRSSIKGTAEEFNELRFEDRKGEEKIYIHAQKVLEKEVEETYQLRVGPKSDHGPSGLTLARTEAEQKLEAAVGPGHDFGPASILMHQTHPEQKMVMEIAPKHDFGPANLTFDQTRMEQSVELKTGPQGAFGPASIKLDKTLMEQYIELKLGQCSIKLDQKPAQESIEIKVGGNSIKLDQMGITIKGLTVKIAGDTQTSLKGLITQLSADAIMQVKGAVTMIG